MNGFLYLSFLAVMLASPISVFADEITSYKRVIAVGGDITEIIYELGQQDKLVGVDTTSYFPPQANILPKVGYKRTLSAEGLLSLNPELIIISGEAGSEAALQQVENSGVKLIKIKCEFGFTCIKEKIDVVTKALGDVAISKKLVQDISIHYNQLQKTNSQITDKKAAIFLLSHAGGRKLVAGKETSAEAFLELSGLKSVANFYGYKPINPESLISLNPDYIIVSKIPTTNEKQLLSELLENPAIANTNAGKERNIIFVEAMESTGFSLRTLNSAQKLNSQIYENE